METRSRKRMRLSREVEAQRELDVEQSLAFLDLNDDVLYSIFKQMELSDLCSLSSTCSRIQALAGDYFQRKYTNNRLDIEIFNWSNIHADGRPQWEIQVTPNEEYTKKFHKFIRNIGIFMYNYETDPMDAFIYLKKNCNEHLRELVLYRISCQTNNYGELIEEQLKTLESVKFENCQIRDIHENFLKHCPALKQLAIKEPNQNDGAAEWAYQHYPKLKSFIYHSNEVIVEVLESFIMKNPQITNIGCSSIQFLRLLISKVLKLDSLYLSFSEYKFNQVAEELQAYCRQGHIKRLELQFHNGWEPSRFTINDIIEVATLPAFQGLHCKEIGKRLNFAAALERFKHLKVLSFGIDHMSKKLHQVLSRKLPNLMELHIETAWSHDSVCGCQLRFFLRQFAIYAPNLEKIAIRGLQRTTLISADDLVVIDVLRQRVKNVKILTIFLEQKFIEAANFTTPTHGFIQLKPYSQLKHDYRKI